MAGSDDFLFADETTVSLEPPWKVLIVDDEPEVHEVTRLVLNGFRFENRPLRFLSAYSAAEARETLRIHADIAVALLDVVMETDHAGLDLVHYVRRDLDNHRIRIVLRTGQPGQAPEHEVISRYDINDYKDKTELTAQRLFTTLYSTLRAYRDIMLIEASRRGLERVIEASAHIFSHQRRHEFASAVLTQIAQLTGMDKGVLYCLVPAHADGEQPEHLTVAAATGEYEAFVHRNADEQLPRRVVQSLREALSSKRSIFNEDHYVLHFTDSKQSESLLYVGEACQINELDVRLIEVFCTNVSIAFENLRLNQELLESQLEMLCLLAGAAETRSRETANHVKRVGHLAELLALEYGVDAETAEMLRLAAPLHDIGKIGIADAILNKPGSHDDNERELMRTHAQLGAQLLAGSSRPLLRLAAQIAAEHHENWDGSGYPKGLKGEQICIGGRITALADVFDALGSRRCYKDSWPEERIRTFLHEQRGAKFEPRLVDILLANWDRAIALRIGLPDEG